MINYHRMRIIHNTDDRKDMKNYHTEFCEFPTVEWRPLCNRHTGNILSQYSLY